MEMGRAPDQGGNGVTGGRLGLNMTESGVEIYPTVRNSQIPYMTFIYHWTDCRFLCFFFFFCPSPANSPLFLHLHKLIFSTNPTVETNEKSHAKKLYGNKLW
jgi:hypothetical protein